MAEAGDAKWLGDIAEDAVGWGLVGRLGVVKFPSLNRRLCQSNNVPDALRSNRTHKPSRSLKPFAFFTPTAFLFSDPFIPGPLAVAILATAFAC